MVQNAAAQPTAGDDFAGLVRTDGSATAPWLTMLVARGDARDWTDAVHALCTLYGGHPDPIELAAPRSDDPDLQAWLADAALAFAAERRVLAALVAAAGPLPSTPNQAQSEAALVHQRHALETLARSDRAGCAIGAAVALVLDWRAVRPLLDRMAARAGVTIVPTRLPADAPELRADPATERARVFGARQLLAQQRSLWVLLEARAAARNR